jgi:protein-S-isoprenylcysteine O-methyltransferase Ste14
VTPLHAIYLMWAAWFASWMSASAWSARTEKRFDAPVPVIVFRFVTLAGAVLLFGPFSPQDLPFAPLWRADQSAGWLLAALTAVGFLFAWWARIHLGTMWSSDVTKKVDHHIVESGPYRLVRHPIYTGLLLSALATAVANGTATALLGAAAISLGLYIKARIEERFLRAELGGDAYASYVRRVPMLVPFLSI